MHETLEVRSPGHTNFSKKKQYWGWTDWQKWIKTVWISWGWTRGGLAFDFKTALISGDVCLCSDYTSSQTDGLCLVVYFSAGRSDKKLGDNPTALLSQTVLELLPSHASWDHFRKQCPTVSSTIEIWTKEKDYQLVLLLYSILNCVHSDIRQRKLEKTISGGQRAGTIIWISTFIIFFLYVATH